jgi:glycogen synthase
MAGCPPAAARETTEPIGTHPDVEVIRVPRIGFPPSNTSYQVMNLNAVFELASNCDVIHGQDCSAFPLIYFCKRKDPKLPWVVTVHTGPTSHMYYALKSVLSFEGSLGDFLAYVIGFPLWDIALRGHVRFADKLVTVSQSLLEEITNLYRVHPRNLLSIHTGVNIQRLESVVNSSSTDFHSRKIRINARELVAVIVFLT